MIFDEQTYDQIHRFLNGEMQGLERSAFEDQVKGDPALKAEVEATEAANFAILSDGLYDLEKKVKDWKPKKKSWFKWQYSLVLLVIPIALLVFNSDEEDTKTKADRSGQEPTEEIAVVPQSEETTQSEQKEQFETDYTTETKTISIEIKDSILHETEIPDTLLAEDPDTSDSLKQIETAEVPADEPEKQIDSLSNPPDPCTGAIITGELNIVEPCEGTNEGAIIISSVKGGTAPYFYSIDEINFTQQNKFENLETGMYMIFVHDNNQCPGIIGTVQIDGKKCNNGKADAFAPELGQVFELPVKFGSSGEFTIFDRAMKPIYSESFQDKATWNGTSNAGALLNTDEYSYKITYDDGTEEIGTVTLIRSN